MSRQVHFVTPENIEVSYELAGIGSRFAAAALDHTLQIAMILLVYLAASAVSSGFQSIGRLPLEGAPGYVQALAGLIVFAIIFGYFVAFELLGGGRTPGKRAAGLRAVRDGGYPLDPYASIVRNLVRIADFLPAAYGVGLISIFVNREYKRLGDLAAGTIVIKERSHGSHGRRTYAESPMVAGFMPAVRNVDRLTLDEFTAIRRFVERRHELDARVQARIAQRIAVPLIQRLEIEAPISHQLQYADLLEAIERRFAQDRGIL